MKRTYKDYLLDILSSIQEIRAFTKGMDFEGFEKDRKTVNAVIRSLEVMGEAVKKIPPEIKDKYPEIPWKYIAGMRDKLIHEYHGVDLEIVWEVIEREIPPIKPKFKKILDELNE
ncbi:MAG: HepT-like ribonuclease domain-containing protein [Promethearchaeota archaeon]